MNNTKELPVSLQIKIEMKRLSDSDGLKRTQRWLARKLGMSDFILSNKLAADAFSETELKKINEVLGSDIRV